MVYKTAVAALVKCLAMSTSRMASPKAPGQNRRSPFNARRIRRTAKNVRLSATRGPARRKTLHLPIVAGKAIAGKPLSLRGGSRACRLPARGGGRLENLGVIVKPIGKRKTHDRTRGRERHCRRGAQPPPYGADRRRRLVFFALASILHMACRRRFLPDGFWRVAGAARFVYRAD
jgi:hypothetical protein